MKKRYEKVEFGHSAGSKKIAIPFYYNWAFLITSPWAEYTTYEAYELIHLHVQYGNFSFSSARFHKYYYDNIKIKDFLQLHPTDKESCYCPCGAYLNKTYGHKAANQLIKLFELESKFVDKNG